MFEILAQAAKQSTDWPLEIVKIVLPTVGVFFAIAIWHYKQDRQAKYNSMNYLAQKKLDGLLKAYSILAYMSDVENPKSVIVWQRNEGQDEYFLRPAQAREYMTVLSHTVYSDGFGLLLSRDIKKILFEYRSQLYGILLREKLLEEGARQVKLENGKMIERLKELYNQLNERLREELEKIRN